MEWGSLSDFEKIVISTSFAFFICIGYYYALRSESITQYLETIFLISIIWEGLILPIHVKYQKLLTKYLAYTPFFYIVFVIVIILLDDDADIISFGGSTKDEIKVPHINSKMKEEISSILSRWNVESIG